MDYRYYEEVYVKIDIPTEYGHRFRTIEDMRSSAQDVIREVKRHVDFDGRIDWDYKSEMLCGFCHLTPDREALGEPFCCDEAHWEWMGEIADFY